MADTHAGLLSEGITLGYKASGSSSYTNCPNLMEIPELGNTAKEKIDVTVLSDDAKHSIDGLGDTAQDLPFKFLYEKADFDALNALDGDYEWQVALPDEEKATFTGTPSLKLAGVGANGAMTYTLTISVKSKIIFA